MKRWRKCVYKPETVAEPQRDRSWREVLMQAFSGDSSARRGYAQMPAHIDKSDIVFDDCL